MDIYFDFDNTLYNTDKLFNDIIELCNSYNIDCKYMIEMRRKIYPFDINKALSSIEEFISFDKKYMMILIKC